MSIYLIGTYHHDKDKGPHKLLEVYDRINPDMILSECDSDTYRHVITLLNHFKAELRKHTSDLDGIDDFIRTYQASLCFEIPFNIEYSKNRSIPHHMIDSPKAQQKVYRSLEKKVGTLIERANEEEHINVQSWLESYEACPEFYDENPKEGWQIIKEIETHFMGELLIFYSRFRSSLGKDKYLEDKIRELYEPGKIIAFPVGMLHITESMLGQTLYSRLKDLNPERIPLI